MIKAIGIDIGTTNTKIEVFNLKDYSQISIINFATPTITSPDRTDIDIGKLDLNIKDGLKEIAAKYDDGDIEFISIASIGESGVLIGPSFISDHSAMWFDRRGFENALKIEGQAYDFYKILGIPNHSNYSLWKLLDQLKDSGENITELQWVSIADYVAFELTNIVGLDASLGSRTYMVNLEEQVAANEILNTYGLSDSIIPEIYESGSSRGVIKEELKQDLGFKSRPFVTVCGHDHMVGSIAVNLQEDEILNSTGTTEGLLMRLREPILTENSYNMNLSNGKYVFENYTYFGSLPTAGYSFEWFGRLMKSQEELFSICNNEIFKEYSNGEFNMNPIIFIPHLRGSGPPVRNAKSTASFNEITGETNLNDLIFGMVLGLCFELKYLLDHMRQEYTSEVHALKVIGPAINNKLWLQLKADVLGLPIIYYDKKEIVTFGSVILTQLRNNQITQDQIKDISDSYATVVLPTREKTNLLESVYNQKFTKYREFSAKQAIDS